MAIPALHHVSCKNVSELSHGDDVQLQHVGDFLERLTDECAVKAVTGIIHKDVDRNATCIEADLSSAAAPDRDRSIPSTRTCTECLCLSSFARFSMGSVRRATSTRFALRSARSLAN